MTSTMTPPAWPSAGDTNTDPAVAMFAAIDAAEHAVADNQTARDHYSRLLANGDATPDDQAAAQAAFEASTQTRRIAVVNAGTVWTCVAHLLDDEARQDASQRLHAIPGVDLAIFADNDTNAAYDELKAAEGWPIATSADIEAVLNGQYEAPTPTLLRRNDGRGLLYAGKVHSLAGEPGGGKTWVALYAVVEALSDGHNAMLVDHEDRLDTAVRRLVALGAEPAAIAARFHYVSPTYVIKGSCLPTNVAALADRCALVVIDSAGEALAFNGLNQNDDGEVRNWFDATARRLADGGAAVLILDHVTKDTEARGRWAIGSQRKLAAIDGMAMTMQTIVAASKTVQGRYVVKCAKDRGGNYMHGTTVADITMDPVGDDVHMVIAAPSDIVDEDGNTLLTEYFRRITEAMEDIDTDRNGMSTKAIESVVKGKAAHVRKALGQLVDLDYLKVTTMGSAHVYTVIRPYGGPDEITETTQGATTSSPRPHLVPETGTRVREGVVPSSPPFRGTRDEHDTRGTTQEVSETAPRPSSSTVIETPPLELDHDPLAGCF